MRIKQFIRLYVLHSDDPPHKLALGISIGLFVAFLPFLGVKTILAIGLAWLLGGNKAVCVPMVWLSNPLTIVPMSYPGYWLGCCIFQQSLSEDWVQTLSSHETWIVKANQLLNCFTEVALPLIVGCCLEALLMAVPTYFISLALISWFRRRAAPNQRTQSSLVTNLS